MDASSQQQIHLGSRRFHSHIQLAESSEAGSCGRHIHFQWQYRLSIQRSVSLEPGPASRQRIEPARLGELRHRLARVQGVLHHAGGWASRLVRRQWTGRGHGAGIPCRKDINPRFAASYDLFGDGRTALKVNVGRFAGADIYTMARANNPVTRAILNASRTWTDTNRNFAPDCNLTNSAAQDL